jgi:AraC family transcriptional regulator
LLTEPIASDTFKLLLSGRIPSQFRMVSHFFSGENSGHTKDMSGTTNQLHPGTFFGQPRGRCTFGGLIFVESAYPAQTVIPPHEHVDPFLYYVLDGVCSEVTRQRCWQGGPSSLVYHPAGEVHSNQWPSAGRCFHIEITKDRLEILRDYARLPDETADFQGSLPAELAFRVYQEYQERDEAASLAMEGIALEMLAAIARGCSRNWEQLRPRWLQQARDLLHDRFAEKLSLDDIAQAIHIHPTHLCRTFRRHFGCSLGEYQRQLRIDYACRQLAGSDQPLINLALAAGFTDQSHFIRTFKRHMGMTPAEFTKTSRGALIPYNKC